MSESPEITTGENHLETLTFVNHSNLEAFEHILFNDKLTAYSLNAAVNTSLAELENRFSSFLAKPQNQQV
jgi:hypothetical protein